PPCEERNTANPPLYLQLQKISADRDSFEDLPRAITDFRNLPAVITGAEMGRDQSLRAGFFRDASGIFHSGMFSFPRHVDRIRTKSGFVDQHRAFVCEFDRAFRKL